MEEVLISVDPHKATNVVAAIDEQGEVVGQQSFPANRKGLRALERWAKRFPKRRWAVEGAGGIGRPWLRSFWPEASELWTSRPSFPRV
jgi:transposase